ncbi:hypothetical protein [Neorhizobium sp. SOG26]|uniref:hypothetical protein n=1 Tax=Neorhizobium sp. SOG26 TaxID=2060726 RepID=UPI0012375989|nr:hypothetical protein [Neorhizobium sp. SOG26]
MLLPTQQAHGLAATSQMQSMLDSIEEQRKREEEQRTGKEKDRLLEARISASEDAKRTRDKIASALFGSNQADANQLKMDLLERLAKKLGLDTDEARSSFKFGKAVEDLVKDMRPDQIRALSDDIGLSELDISMDTLIAAIKNPYGDDSERLKDALTRKVNGGRIDADLGRVLQRMDDVADPKTLEELKLGPQGGDPARVEDGEARAERREDIKAAEAGRNLEEVRKLQEAVRQDNENGLPLTDDADAAAPVTDEAISVDDEAEAEKKTDGIVPVYVDEIGLYELRDRKQAA